MGKLDFLTKDRIPKNVQIELLTQDNARLVKLVEELERQNTSLKAAKASAETKLKEAAHFVPGVRQLDVRGLSYLFGNDAKCREEEGMIILSDVVLYRRACEIPVEICLPPGAHFEQLSQVVDVVSPLDYPGLVKVISTYGEDVSAGKFLPCTWSMIRNKANDIIARRLTLTSPASRQFAYVLDRRVSEITLSGEEYLRRITEHRGGEKLSEEHQEKALAFLDEAIEIACETWQKKFPGVIFPDQSKTD